jgi:hypothetical protein
MQTFVPYPDFAESAAVLDNKRLNKQLLEGRQIYQILVSGRRTGGWVNHPAVKMWRNYDMSFFNYLESVKDECVHRGIQTEKNWNAILDLHEKNWNRGSKIVMPPWWNDERVHESHRNNLYVKDSGHYAIFSSAKRVACCDKCNYFWPTHTSVYGAEFAGYVV